MCQSPAAPCPKTFAPQPTDHKLLPAQPTDEPQVYREVGLVDPSSTLNHDQFVALLKAIDSGLRALPATAQVGCCRVGVWRQRVAVERAHALPAIMPCIFRMARTSCSACLCHAGTAGQLALRGMPAAGGLAAISNLPPAACRPPIALPGPKHPAPPYPTRDTPTHPTQEQRAEWLSVV